MEWKVFVAIAIVFWAGGQVLIRKGFGKVSVADTFFMGGIWGFLVYIPYILMNLDKVQTDWILFLTGGFIVSSYLVYYKALSVGNFSVNSTITSTFPLVTVLLAQIFLNEPLEGIQWFGLGLIIFGLIAINYVENGGFSVKQFADSHILWAVVASIYIGLGDFLAKILEGDYSSGTSLQYVVSLLDTIFSPLHIHMGQAVEHMIGYSYSYASIFLVFGFMQLMIGFLIKLILERKRFNFTVFRTKSTISGNFLLSAGTLFFYLALFSGWASIVVPVSASYIIITVILARLFLKEQLKTSQYIFISLIVLGNIFINL